MHQMLKSSSDVNPSLLLRTIAGQLVDLKAVLMEEQGLTDQFLAVLNFFELAKWTNHWVILPVAKRTSSIEHKAWSKVDFK
jgi:hypothetical protein